MIRKQDIKRISDVKWEIPKSYRDDMRVPVQIFADERLLEAALGDKSLTQAVNASTLPGLVSHIIVMPDVHQGYGFPIGGVAATKLPDGVISPGGIGYDINCGVRLLSSLIPLDAAEPFLDDLATSLYANCPSGVGVKGSVRLSLKQLEAVCRIGSEWALKNGYARAEDLPSTEEGGKVPGADPSAVSERAMARGRPQLGTLGAGNHFIEIDVVEEIYHPEGARAMGLLEGHLALQIHCGSRGFGHQVCSDYVRELQGAVRRYGIQLPDRELVCAPLSSPEGKRYLAAMTCAANYAFANRFTRFMISPTTWGKSKNMWWMDKKPRFVFIERGLRARLALVSQVCPKNTGPWANLFSCLGVWERHHGCFLERKRVWSSPSGRAVMVRAVS